MLDDKKIKEVEEQSGHSVYGPSSLPRVISCPGSVGASLDAPPEQPSKYAAKGTQLHDYSETAMKHYVGTGGSPTAYVWDQTWEWEDKLLVVAAVDYVMEVVAKHKAPLIQLEAKGSLKSWGVPEVYGTMDVEIASDDRIDVLDYKFGHGIQVFAEGNVQCASYLAASVGYGTGATPVQELYVHIVQPTLEHYDMWSVSWDELCQVILGKVQTAVNASKVDSPLFAPSMEACRWCRVKNNCQHRNTGLSTMTTALVSSAIEPEAVNKDKWKKILDMADTMQQAIKDVRAYAAAEIKSGRGFPGYKMVAGRANRFWINEEHSKQYLLQQAMAVNAKKSDEDERVSIYLPMKMVSPAQAEKLFPKIKKKKEFNTLIGKGDGKPTLQRETHPKAAITYGITNEFSEIAAADGDVIGFTKN